MPRSRTQHGAASGDRTQGLSIRSFMLYHNAAALPLKAFLLLNRALYLSLSSFLFEMQLNSKLKNAQSITFNIVSTKKLSLNGPQKTERTLHSVNLLDIPSRRSVQSICFGYRAAV